ncbi:hypothetical protein BXY85_1559 [Roseivirga pacifica]|uniref:DUF1682 domain-containing protein n=1 Tax=Roseivirga pacifica TaxID=1267423 RepID=A0A1I0MNG2_9BACT|nr:hypothetical protein [Roseivirga pacifica]RKQ50543.1 hypothetical protein BXY85_1559 [Roseivirga pacifica]SEV89720.1 hypothetical protein SAMN05216290_0543 [Roseivirga pacifica]
MKKVIHKYKYFFYPLFGAVALFLFGSVIMLLWNWLMPEIFGLTTINFWQALGLFILSRILFSGMGGKKKHTHKHKWGDQKGREKWMKMSSEERKEWFKKKRFAEWMEHRSNCFADSDTKEKNGSDSE